MIYTELTLVKTLVHSFKSCWELWTGSTACHSTASWAKWQYRSLDQTPPKPI